MCTLFCSGAGESVRTDLMIDPRSKALVLNGKPGHLQFYSLQRDKLLYNVSIQLKMVLIQYAGKVNMCQTHALLIGVSWFY